MSDCRTDFLTSHIRKSECFISSSKLRDKSTLTNAIRTASPLLHPNTRSTHIIHTVIELTPQLPKQTPLPSITPTPASPTRVRTMSASKKPTIVLIPGSFLHSSHYTPTIQPLHDAGVSIHILDPPCYHSKKPGDLPTMYDDASFISSFVEKLADQGEEVVLVSHSYGGTPTTEGLKGLSVAERRKQGRKGGVVRLAYITAVVPKVGGGLADTMVGGVQVPLEPDAVSVFLFGVARDCI